MKRALKVLVPLVVLVEAVLVLSGAMELGNAVLVVAGIEALLMLIGIGGVILIIRRYRRERKAGLDPLRALEDALSLALPQSVARLVTHELRIFAAMLRWTFRRVRLGDNEFSYHKRSLLRSLMPMLVFVLPVELFFVHLLAYLFSPWGWLTWALLVLEIYAFFWLLGLYASLITLPYRLEEMGLRLRHGVFAEGFIPYSQITDVVRKECRAPSSADGLQHAADEDALYLSASGKTEVVLRLNAPTTVRGFFKESKPASRVYLAVDDPKRLAAEIRQRISDPAAHPGSGQLPNSVKESLEGSSQRG